MVENESNWDESNLATSAKKKRNQSVVGADASNRDTPAGKRSKQESNLRRRIYDAWNVLKAANIIVGHDEKHFSCNPDVIKDLDSESESDDEDDQLMQKGHLKIEATVRNLSLHSSGSHLNQ